MLAAVSVIITRFVSRWALRLPCAGTNGRRRATASGALMIASGTIWVTISSPGMRGSGSLPTTVLSDDWVAPSLGMTR